MRRHIEYARYIFRHKWFVFVAACKLGVPWLGLLHDNSKFLPDEWFPYARHFYEPDGSKRTRKAPDGFYADQADDAAFDRAWLRHIRRNRHHPQHWVRIDAAPCHISDHDRFTLFEDDGYAKCLMCVEKGYQGPGHRFLISEVRYVAREMPERYRREMLADWIGAGMAQGTPDTLGWYATRGRNYVFAPETRAWIESKLGFRDALAELA
jgi:hypothetical protein